MNAVNVGLVTFIIQHNRIQGVFLLCKITNLLIYSLAFNSDSKNNITILFLVGLHNIAFVFPCEKI